MLLSPEFSHLLYMRSPEFTGLKKGQFEKLWLTGLLSESIFLKIALIHLFSISSLKQS